MVPVTERAHLGSLKKNIEICQRTGGETESGMDHMVAGLGAGIETVNLIVAESEKETAEGSENESGTAAGTGNERGTEAGTGNERGTAAGTETETGTRITIAPGTIKGRKNTVRNEIAVEAGMLIDTEKVMETKGGIGTEKETETVAGSENLTGRTMTETGQRAENETVTVETVEIKDENAQEAVNEIVEKTETGVSGTETGKGRGTTEIGGRGVEVKRERKREEINRRLQRTLRDLLILKAHLKFLVLVSFVFTTVLTSFDTQSFISKN